MKGDDGFHSRLRRWRAQATDFLLERGIEGATDGRQPWPLRSAHFWLLVIKSFIRNRCPARASALAYTTLLALVPLLAVGVSITTSLLQKEGEKPVRELIQNLVKYVAPALDLRATEDGPAGSNRDEVVTRITDFIANIQSGTLGVTSTIALVFVAIGLLRTIEAAFNDIWGVTNGRGWVASVIQYWATITLGPVILVVVIGLTTGPQFQRLQSLFAATSLTADDVVDFPGLAGKLVRQADPLSTYLLGRLETGLQADLRVVATNGVPSRGARRALADNLSQIIEGDSIYEETRFATITLEPGLKAAASQASAGRPVARLNRRLLEAAYPHELRSQRPAWVESLAFQLLPYVVLSLAFGMFYQLMPNTQVQWRAALAGGVVGGTLWQLNNKLSVLYVSQALTYSKIYGSLGIIPLFLIGLYFSWLILLFGAQVAYAFQNRQAYLEEKQAEGVHQKGREFVALRLMARIAAIFAAGEPPPTVRNLSEALGVPTKLIAQILGVLLQERLVAEVNRDDTGYVPARPIDTITAHHVLQALRVGHGQELAPHDDGLLGRVRGEFDRIGDAEKGIADAVTLARLVQSKEPYDYRRAQGD